MPNTYLPIDDKITLFAKEGFSSDLYHYQYRLQGESTWNDVSGSLYNADKLTFSARDILGNSYENHLGEKVEVRVVSCYRSGTYLSFSDPVLLTLIQSSPHIVSKSESPVKCHDSEDGSITLNFDRALLNGETLEYSLVNTTTGAAHSNGYLTDLLQSSTAAIIENLPPGNYKLDLLGTYKSNPTYSDGMQHSTTFEIKRPTAVIATFVSKTDVFCHQGSDGIINISATGGQNQYQYSIIGDNGINRGWTNFNNGNNTSITNLTVGTYQITVQDSNLCPAKESGSVKVITIEITEPSAPIALSETEIVQPTGYGLSNGYISVRVTGGTPNNDGSYNFEWRKDSPSGTVISTGIITDAINNPYTIKLENIPKGKYYLTVKDKNYAGASSNLNTCGIISQEYEVDQPDLLVATIYVKKIISCNIQNDYEYKLDLDDNGIPDEAETGELRAIVTGGVGNYTYQWQKLENGSFQNITGATTNILTKLQEGTYKVLVTDVNNNKANDQKIFNYPEVLAINLSANTILCNNVNEGIVSVTATGGTAPYTYYWNTTNTTPTVTGLSAGNYFVVVQDANKCTVSGSIRIEQPEQLEIEDVEVQNPICNGADDGTIRIKASGGKIPYSIVWSNGVTGENLSDLRAGLYTVTFTDANGCTITKDYTLTAPEVLTIDLGKDITLCQGDTQTYDIKIDDPAASYRWQDMQGNIIGTSSFIELSAAGIYTATVTDSKGCIATDQVEIKNSMEVLSPEFMIASHAFVDRTVELVNTSTVRPEKVEWILPESDYITVISKSDEHIELQFSQVGSYQIGLKGIQGLCEKTMYKDILIEENITPQQLSISLLHILMPICQEGWHILN